jgi:hypothetical protein
VKQIIENRAKIVTLWIGILMALLLIFGSFAQSFGAITQVQLFGGIMEHFSGDHFTFLSSILSETLHSLGF